jgi:hypothetical protein
MAVDKKELWLDWTHDAISQYEKPEDIKSLDDLIDDMSEFVTMYADEMLDQFEERVANHEFDSSPRRSARRRPPEGERRPRRRREPEDTDPDGEGED